VHTELAIHACLQRRQEEWDHKWGGVQAPDGCSGPLHPPSPHHEHRPILPLLAVVVEGDGRLCCVLPWAAGGDVRRSPVFLAPQGRRMPEPDVRDALVRPLLRALVVLAEVGVVHRDIKPENCLVPSCSSSSKMPEVQLADMGLAVFTTAGEEHAQPLGPCGSPNICTAAAHSQSTGAGGVEAGSSGSSSRRASSGVASTADDSGSHGVRSSTPPSMVAVAGETCSQLVDANRAIVVAATRQACDFHGAAMLAASVFRRDKLSHGCHDGSDEQTGAMGHIHAMGVRHPAGALPPAMSMPAVNHAALEEGVDGSCSAACGGPGLCGPLHASPSVPIPSAGGVVLPAGGTSDLAVWGLPLCPRPSSGALVASANGTPW
jgi:hypothetical protein